MLRIAAPPYSDAKRMLYGSPVVTQTEQTPKSAWEVTPYYTRCFDKGKLFTRGRKPRELAKVSATWTCYSPDNLWGTQQPVLNTRPASHENGRFRSLDSCLR